MMKRIMTAIICMSLLAACSKDDDNNSNNNSGGNTLKVTKGGGGGTVNVTLSSIVCGSETVTQGTFWSQRSYFKVGSSIYDRLAIGFKSEPAAGSFPVTFQQYYPNLPADKSGVNITYDSYNYIVNSGSVTVTVVNGKKKLEFNNLLLESGAAIPGTTGTKLPDGSTISGAIICP